MLTDIKGLVDHRGIKIWSTKILKLLNGNDLTEITPGEKFSKISTGNRVFKKEKLKHGKNDSMEL